MSRPNDEATKPFSTTPVLTRRGFVQAGGALFVSLTIPGTGAGKVPDAGAADSSLDPSLVSSWLEIRADGTIIARTGRTEVGTGVSAYYAQMIAEELRVRPEVISLIMGDTDATPDGGYSAGFMGGAENLRKVSAYTYQALLELASAELGVSTSSLTASDGVVSSGGRSLRYGDLVRDQQLELTIPVEGRTPRLDADADVGLAGLDGFTVLGDPPLKPIEEYTVIGKSHPMPGIPDMVTGSTVWSGDVRRPGMLHARMIRPKTLGSELIEVGRVDRKRFPTARVVHKGNLVAVVSPNEWEAVTASRDVAAGTRWTDWAGLPSSDQLTRVLREHSWGKPKATRGDAAKVAAGLASAATTVAASYEQPCVRHAPIGPYVAVADVGKDGRVTVWTHSAHSQALRVRIAHLLGISPDGVVIRWLEGSGQYGRGTNGGDGAEADAVILSQLVGRPVRVQWTLEEDLAWSSLSPAWVADVEAALDRDGRLVALQSDWYSPHENDARLLGAVLAGMPGVTPRVDTMIQTEWPYDEIELHERVYAMPNIGADAPVTRGLRGNIMRTPMQRQQAFALESALNEAAAAAGADPIQFRLDHTSDPRLIDVIRKTADAADWVPRPAPNPRAARKGAETLTGRGVGVLVRTGGYWVGIAEIEVRPDTGQVQVTKFTMGLDCGKVINPRQLERCMQGGIVMGLGEALKEEVTFDERQVTSTNWNLYQILTMEELPEIQIVRVPRDDQGFGMAGEAPNALPPQAVAAAFFDATGVQPRRIPLTPAYVKALLWRAS